MTDKTLGAVQLATGAVMISFSPVLVKLAHVGPTAAAFYRNAFGGLVLLLLALGRRQGYHHGWRFFLLAAASGFLFSMDVTLWHHSVHWAGPGLATILTNFQVFLLAAFGVFVLKEKLTWRLVLACPLGIIGLVLLVGLDWSALDQVYRAGVVCGLAAAVAYTAFLLVLRRTQGRPGAMGPLANMTVVCLAAALTAWPIARSFGESLFIPDGRTWVVLVMYGLAGQVLGWVLISKGLPHVETSKAGLILLLQPTLAFVWDVLFFGRSAAAPEVLGAALALTAIYLGSTGRRPAGEG
ncbi:MAG: DMT family transporter [Thermodesulfobacteriota bacterium]